MRRKRHRPKITPEPLLSVVKQILVPVIIEASAPVVPCGLSGPRSGSAAGPVSAAMADCILSI